jgi:hypothetical protein
VKWCGHASAFHMSIKWQPSHIPGGLLDYGLSAYQRNSCEFDSHSWSDVLDRFIGVQHRDVFDTALLDIL